MLRYVTFPRSRYRPDLSKSRNRDTRNMRRSPARSIEILSARESARRILDRGDRSILPSSGDAAFRANLRRRSRSSFFSIWSTSIINNLANITLSAIKIRRTLKVIHWRTQCIYVYTFLNHIFQHFFLSINIELRTSEIY